MQTIFLKIPLVMNNIGGLCGQSFSSRYKASEIIVMDQVQKYMDGQRLLCMRLGELVPHSLGWNCTLGVGV